MWIMAAQEAAISALLEKARPTLANKQINKHLRCGTNGLIAIHDRHEAIMVMNNQTLLSIHFAALSLVCKSTPTP
jgi:hypothetical protein